ncbi:hypothetical protein L0B53_15815 [Vibrio sp. SS-MA-C1-2]|uniref:hypothetical protein n=1 Tax=Vibrio sp. SS-MA-C1-2 TaxID=2908646 RepID=UPI001F1F3432|nr:hypothetical protein [Vibrio sp. SS-MA-C1-2]UJF18472.1 hypothetical protein L0B53_15815 [Vibrio sp. SS-MA-C1-2]
MFKIKYSAILLLLLSANSYSVTTTYTDSVIVQGSLCAGSNSCGSNENFDYDTLRIKADDPILRLNDTSASASFPSNDWAIGAVSDDSASSSSVFYIEDASASSKVLQISTSSSGGGVALGSGSTLVDGAVSIGSTGDERRIVNVADGTADSDAVTKSQLDAAISSLTSQLNTLITEVDGL